MQFITNRIHLAPVSLGDVVAKAQNKADPRPLEDILASIAEGNKQVKTASTSPVTKEAGCSCGADDCPTCGDGEGCDCENASKGEHEEGCRASATAEVKTAELEILELSEEEEAKYFGQGDEVEEDLGDHEKATPLASSKKTLKVAKKADFRGWNAEDVIKAWGNYGSVEKCVAATSKLTSDPKLYCGLLQVASSEAVKHIKTAAKTAAKDCDCTGKCPESCDCVCHEKEESYSSADRRFRKVAKLTGKDLGMLRKYFGELYGEAYVTALLDEYAD